MASEQNINFQVRDMDQYTQDAKRTEPAYGPVVQRLADARIARLLHVAMGLVTEAGEFMDQLKRHIFYGAPLDTVNLLEEMGDITWYQRLGVDELESTLLDILDRNVAKLKKRFPEKFNEAQAVTRDLGAERKALECNCSMHIHRPIGGPKRHLGTCPNYTPDADPEYKGVRGYRSARMIPSPEQQEMVRGILDAAKGVPHPELRNQVEAFKLANPALDGTHGSIMKLKDGHLDCPCWATGKYVWVEGCAGHPMESVT